MYDLDLIFDEWKAALRNKNRSAAYVASNFEELFETFRSAGATFEEVHPYVVRAAKAHYPSLSLAKKAYKDSKHLSKMVGLSEKDFIEQWTTDIDGKASSVFYSIFPRPKTAEEKEEEDDPKVYGSMSVKEYRMQRSHAESFPRLDTEELERRQQAGVYNPLEDLPLLLDKVKNGDSN